MKAIVNRQANYDYEILDKFQAGLVLKGHEVKAVKEGKINLKGSFVTIKNKPRQELFLSNVNIARYSKAGALPEYDPTRPRKLLVKKKEIASLAGKLQQKGLTLVPIRVYTINNRIKLEFGLAKGKKKFDKRQTIKKRETDRQIQRILRQKR